MKKEFFTTSQIAKISHHTGETVKRWLEIGEIRGYRVGTSGHWRVLPQDLALFLTRNNIPFPLPEEVGIDLKSLTDTMQSPIFCWEFFKNRMSKHLRAEGSCEDCLVYKVKAINCHALRKEVGHECVYCANPCENCEYFQFQQKEIQPEIEVEPE